MNKPILKAVGYWRSYDEHSEFPDPKCLVYPNWHSQIDAIVRYLRNGPTCGYWCGFSYCRFKCGVRSDQMGSTDLTDGEWIWPHGLAHYIEHHSVALPEEFIQTMADNDWVCPGVNDLPDAIVMSTPFDDDYDIEWDSWANWGRKMTIVKTPIYRRIPHLDEQ